MNPFRTLALAAVAAPLAALAQVSYYDGPLTRGELAVCMERDYAVRERRAAVEDERHGNDLEAGDIARVGAQLAEELRQLDARDLDAVADYNARSNLHNARVAAHNRRIAEMNARVALLNGDAADVASACAERGYLLRDRDAILYERPSTIR